MAANIMLGPIPSSQILSPCYTCNISTPTVQVRYVHLPRAPYPMSMLRAALHSFSKLYGDRYARYNIRMNNLLLAFTLAF